MEKPKEIKFDENIKAIDLGNGELLIGSDTFENIENARLEYPKKLKSKQIKEHIDDFIEAYSQNKKKVSLWGDHGKEAFEIIKENYPQIKFKKLKKACRYIYVVRWYINA